MVNTVSEDGYFLSEKQPSHYFYKRHITSIGLRIGMRIPVANLMRIHTDPDPKHRWEPWYLRMIFHPTISHCYGYLSPLRFYGLIWHFVSHGYLCSKASPLFCDDQLFFFISDIFKGVHWDLDHRAECPRSNDEAKCLWRRISKGLGVATRETAGNVYRYWIINLFLVFVAEIETDTRREDSSLQTLDDRIGLVHLVLHTAQVAAFQVKSRNPLRTHMYKAVRSDSTPQQGKEKWLLKSLKTHLKLLIRNKNTSNNVH